MSQLTIMTLNIRTLNIRLLCCLGFAFLLTSNASASLKGYLDIESNEFVEMLQPVSGVADQFVNDGRNDVILMFRDADNDCFAYITEDPTRPFSGFGTDTFFATSFDDPPTQIRSTGGSSVFFRKWIGLPKDLMCLQRRTLLPKERSKLTISGMFILTMAFARTVQFGET